MAIDLEVEQHELLAKFVEAHRNTPQEYRGAFIALLTHDEPLATFLHSLGRGVQFQGSLSDAEILANAGLLRMSHGRGGDPTFSVLPRGIAAYEERKGSCLPLAAVAGEPPSFLSSAEFKNIHAAAYTKWEQAAGLLWAAESTTHLTTIGHLCREALQAFAASLAREHKLDVSSIEAAKTVERLQTILKSRHAHGATRKAFLSALVAYWGTVSDLVQRQEHGALREGEVLVWEDARCVVFQTCIVMFEITRALR